MKLQKQSSRKVVDVEYPKWVVVIPSEKIKELGWKERMELDLDSKRNELILKPKKF